MLEYKVSNDGALDVRARRALEVADTDDPHATKPFAGLSRNQLSLIVYDDSGAYTLNERESARLGVQQIDGAWTYKVITEGRLEKTMTGGSPTFYRECLAHYRALPKIERAMHPVDYEATTLRRIEEDIEAQRTGKKDQTMLSLVELLARMSRKLPGHVAGGENPSLADIDKSYEAKEIKTNN